MSRSKVLYSGPYFDGREIEAAITTLKEGAWYPAGKEVDKFERAFSRKFGFDSSLMVNSGSSANLVMLAALKKYFEWPDGAEIIVSVVGFPTTINPIIQNGLTPRFG
jgi:CDP-6-deoxy-D-xylo-4-hexulose-3-dehydrase